MPRGLALLLVGFLVVAAALMAGDVVLHDEGVLTYIFASWFGEEPLLTAAFLKARPPLAALYAPFTASLDLFLVAHTLVGASGVVFAYLLARRLGHRRPAFPAAVVATSSLFLAAAVGGQGNADGVVLLLAAAWLLSTHRLVLAGVLLGAMPLARAELAIFALVLTLWVARAHGRRCVVRLAAGALTIPLLVWIAGMVVHGDALWWLTYPPALPHRDPDNPVFWGSSGARGVAGALETLVVVSAAWPLLFLARKSVGLEGALAAASALFAGLVVGLPHLGLFNFDGSARYLLPLLPVVSLGVSRYSEQEQPASLGGLAALAVCAGLAAAGVVSGLDDAALWTIMAVAMIETVRIARPDASRLISFGIVVLLLAGPLAWFRLTGLQRTTVAPAVQHAADHLASLPRPPARVVTNIALLQAYLRHTPGAPTVSFLMGSDQADEVRTLSAPGAQHDAFKALTRTDFYGEAIWPHELDPSRFAPGTLFLLERSARLDKIMPPAVWGPWLETVAVKPGVTIARLREVSP